MNTIDELKRYCTLPETAGALLLTGEWGCGKTFLIDHILANELKESCIILRISLFGIESIEHLQNSVLKAWLELYCHEYGIDKANIFFKKAKNILTQLPIPDKAKTLVNFDITSLITIERTINHKKIILVWDDLERSSLEVQKLFGYINNYCENQTFPTIIITNESDSEILSKNNPENQLSYKEIKEKTIQKTVKYQPNYEKIIADILKNTQFSERSKKYQNFLLSNKQNLVNLFIGKASGTPKNIRCFKCGILEFYQLFEILHKYEMEHIAKYMYTFLSFYMACKSGIVDTNADSEKLFQKIRSFYPYWFDTKFFLMSEKAWILSGEWNEKKITEDINHFKTLQKPMSSADILRTSSIKEMDEQDIDAGFHEVLSLAYNGKLSINEYVQFISNVHDADAYHYPLPISINWTKIENGIQKQIQYTTKKTDDNYTLPETHLTISEKNLSAAEQHAYQIIHDYRKNNILLKAKNKKYYITNIRSNTYPFWSACRKIDFRTFDMEMAKATSDAFISLSNRDRNMFKNEFIGCWENCDIWNEIDKEQPAEGINQLMELLNEKRNIMEEENKKISCAITNEFIYDLAAIAEKLK